MYKKNGIITTAVEELELPDTGVLKHGEYKLKIKGALPGEVVSAQMKKRKGGSISARLIEVLEKAPYETEPMCPHFGMCGGCCFQRVPYSKQLDMKEDIVLSLFRDNNISIGRCHGILASPEEYAYRNKMEFSFGDTGPGGELSLGLRRRNSWYEVVHVSGCMLVDGDFSAIISETLRYFKERGTQYYSTRRRDGLLRHLVVRKSKRYGSVLVNLVTASGIDDRLVEGFKEVLLALKLEGTLTGILHTVNDSLSDTVKLDNVRILHGQDYFYESISDLDFKITPASFFQTNTLGAELLYKTVTDLAGDCGLVYDLYCGTGTITQILSRRAKKAVGIEIVPDAVLSARESSKMNGITNAEFICGDVLEMIGTLTEKPDLIVVDPPRDGIHPKALKVIASFGAEYVIYISCKPSSLVRDLKTFLEHGYGVSDCAIVDMFPVCGHVETVVVLRR